MSNIKTGDLSQQVDKYYELLQKLSPEKRALLEARLKKKVTETAGQEVIPRLHRASGSNVFPASFAQQRLWFIDQLEAGSATYNIPVAFRLKGELSLNALEDALNEIIRRHEVLRTVFPSQGGKPVQEVREFGEIKLGLIDLAGLAREEQGECVTELAREEAALGFDLGRGMLIRAKLLRQRRDESVLLVIMHHIVSDGWSVAIMARELTRLYKSMRGGERCEIAELPIQYADFALWQRDFLQGQLLHSHLSYWRNQLDALSILDLPTDHPRPPSPTHRGASLSFLLPPDLTLDLKAISRRLGATLFMTLVAAFKLLLSRYSGQQDISVGTPIANRNRVETEPLIGFFVNQLVLRTTVSASQSFVELLRRVREVTLEAYTHQDLPFEMLVEQLQPERSLTHSPLFQVTDGAAKRSRTESEASRGRSRAGGHQQSGGQV